MHDYPIGEAEAACRAFAQDFGHLPNVARGMAAAERGEVAWIALEALFAQALGRGLEAVRG